MDLSSILSRDEQEALYVEIGCWVFVWHGGSYIDILLRHPSGKVEYTDQCINVYDYAEGRVAIPFEINALMDECINFLNQG